MTIVALGRTDLERLDRNLCRSCSVSLQHGVPSERYTVVRLDLEGQRPVFKYEA